MNLLKNIPLFKPIVLRLGFQLMLIILSVAFISSCTKVLPDEFEGNQIMSPDFLNSVTIAPTAEAITFARYKKENSTHVILVSSYQNNIVTGIDLTEAFANQSSDPIELFLAVGYDSIANMHYLAQQTVSVSDEDLILPADLIDHHIAAGVNFPEHADEISVQDGPFLFPKIVAPTPAFSEVNINKGLLDYETEIGWVLLEPLKENESLPQYMGLILCNDFTDRQTLLKNIDNKDIISGKGFTSGKSFPGYLPVGNLFVIPKDYHSFTGELELNLYVNYQLRQTSKVNRAIWGIDELINQTWLRKDVTWKWFDKEVSLFADDDNSSIKERVIILSGTPPGTVFNTVTTDQRISGLFNLLFFGWGESLGQNAINNYIKDAKAAGIYLFPGDYVDIHVEKMGVIRNQVVE